MENIPNPFMTEGSRSTSTRHTVTWRYSTGGKRAPTELTHRHCEPQSQSKAATTLQAALPLSWTLWMILHSIFLHFLSY